MNKPDQDRRLQPTPQSMGPTMTLRWLAQITTVLTMTALVNGCGTSGPVQAKTDPTAERVAAAATPWFCQVGDTDEMWNCIRLDHVGAYPAPARHPQPLARPRTGNPRATSVRSEPTRAAAVTEAVAPQDVAAAATSSKRQRAASRRSVMKSADTPPYVALSYRPQKPVAILDLPQEFWAVQLLAVSSKQVLEDYAVTNNISGMSAARIAVNDDLYYVLLLGVYETRANAEEAILFLPPPFDKKQPWIRTVGSLQRAMLAGDRLAGDT